MKPPRAEAALSGLSDMPSGFGDSSALDTSIMEQWLTPRLGPSRWIGWRLRGLLLAALLGCLGVFLLARSLAVEPALHAQWRANAQGQIELLSADEPTLKPFVGRTLIGVIGPSGQVAVVDPVALERSARWISDDARRSQFIASQSQLRAALDGPNVRLFFSDGGSIEVPVHARGAAHFGLLFWLLTAFALVLYLVAWLVALVQPSRANALFALMALAQCGNLLLIAAPAALELALPTGFPLWEWRLRTVFDLVTSAAIVHAVAIHPRRLPGAELLAAVGWLVAAAVGWAVLHAGVTSSWWWVQGTGAGLGIAAVALLSWSHRIEPHPYAMVMRRFGIVTIGTWVLLTVAVGAVGQPGMEQQIASVGSTVWTVFLAALLLLMPFLAKSQQLLREFALLAGISTVATSLDLLFVAVFSLGQFTSITLSLFLAFGIYAGVRQWVLNHLRGRNMVTMERLFERLYRMAREVELHPERAAPTLLSLLRELFEPLEALVAAKGSERTRASGDGSTLLVPVPDLSRPSGRADQTLVIRFAQRGQRLFTDDDARLADRITEQLRRAVAFDQAVERGRSEERLRLAQDLHDDIGARLLTLMYQAGSPEQEEYIRHTLQDLKTLTRGLAAQSHRLSHAAGEWKADLQQRLQMAHCELDWQLHFDQDVELNVVQWSALTRVLRELVSNIIAHAQATKVSILLRLVDDVLDLHVRDDGQGRHPEVWAHGLGLGGVRKRVKQLTGQVQWREAQPKGIECRVRIPNWSGQATPP